MEYNLDQGTIDVCTQGMNRHIKILTILTDYTILINVSPTLYYIYVYHFNQNL